MNMNGNIVVGDWVWFAGKRLSENRKMNVVEVLDGRAICIWINDNNIEERASFNLSLLTKEEPKSEFFLFA